MKPIVFPNEWHKSKSKGKTAQSLSAKAESYKNYFQQLIDDLREHYRFTSARAGQPQNWYAFASGVITGVNYGANFCQGNKVRTELYIDFGSAEENKACLAYLLDNKKEIEEEFGTSLSWEPIDGKRAARVAIYRNGSIFMKNELPKIKEWHIANLLKFKKVFSDRLVEYIR